MAASGTTGPERRRGGRAARAVRAADRAVTLEPAGMRSLEALHLASALELGDDLEGVVTYDGRLAAAVAMTGYPVVAPA